MEKVSAIVAIYKSEKFLPKLIDSIINQTWQNLEILLVDDGSPDNSGTICDDYAWITFVSIGFSGIFIREFIDTWRYSEIL